MSTVFGQMGTIVKTELNNKAAALQTNIDTKFDKTGGTISGSIIPSSNITYDLGSPTNMWKDIYVGPGSLYVNGQKVLEDNAGTITVSADINQNVQIQTSGSGDIEFYPSGTGVLQMKGTVSLLSGTNLTTSDGQPISCPAGFGDLTVQNLTVAGTTTTVNTAQLTVADNIITLNADVTGTPTENAGIEVERGDSNNAKILFNETIDSWQFTSDGVNYITMGDVSDHSHDINDVTGIQSALDGKVDDSQVLTDVPAGAVFTDTVYTHPTTHTISEVSGLQTALNNKVDDSQVLTDVPAGAVFTDTVYSHPTTHTISEVTGLQTELDSKLTTGSVIPTGTQIGTSVYYDASIEINQGGTGNRYSYIDFHGDDINTDFASRIIRHNTGVNADMDIISTGTGALNIMPYGGDVNFKTADLTGHFFIEPDFATNKSRIGHWENGAFQTVQVQSALEIVGISDGQDALRVGGPDLTPFFAIKPESNPDECTLTYFKSGVGSVTTRMAGSWIADTQTTGDDTTKVATTAFVQQELASVTSLNVNETEFVLSSDDTSVAYSYTVGKIQIFYNGILMRSSQYTSTNGTSVTFSEAAQEGDVVQIFTFGVS